jgi:hypothetical protein
MTRVLVMAATVTAVVAADASAAGRLRGRGGCGCTPPTTPVYAAPQPAASCSGYVVTPGMPGTVVPSAPAVVPGPAAPAAPVAPGGHHH